MNLPKIKVYGTRFCGDCHQAVNFLRAHNVPFHWIDIDQDKTGEQYVLMINQGMRSVPTIEFQDGSILVEPTSAELAEKLTSENKN
jgi:glutaredoxin-like protein